MSAMEKDVQNVVAMAEDQLSVDADLISLLLAGREKLENEAKALLHQAFLAHVRIPLVPSGAKAATCRPGPPNFGCASGKSAVVGSWAVDNAVASGPRQYLEDINCPSSSERPWYSSFVRPLGDVWLLSPGPRWANRQLPNKALPTLLG